MSAAGGSPGPRPWYREFWPWALMLPPLLSVVGGVTMIVLATHTSNALVVEDYARIEELTAERFERDREAARLDLAATVTFASDEAAGRVLLTLDAPAGFSLPRVLMLRLRHASDPAADRELRLVRYGDSFAAEAAMRPGWYEIELMPEDGTWRLGAGAVRLEGQIALRSPHVGG